MKKKSVLREDIELSIKRGYIKSVFSENNFHKLEMISLDDSNFQVVIYPRSIDIIDTISGGIILQYEYKVNNDGKLSLKNIYDDSSFFQEDIGYSKDGYMSMSLKFVE